MECNIKGNTIHYEVIGTGKPILCIHGYPEDHHVMKGCLEPIFKNNDTFQRIYIDLPGMGKSIVSKTLKNADDMIDVIASFMNTIIGNKNFSIIGQSYGGYLTLGLLLHKINRINGVFLLCPCVTADNKKRILPMKTEPKNINNFIDTYKEEEYFGDFMEYAAIASEGAFNRFKKEVLPGLLTGNQSFIKQYQEEGYACSYIEDIKKIAYHRPVTILTGKQDHCVGYEEAFELTKNFSKASFILLNNAGHNLQLEQEELFISHMLNCLKQI
ncbi:MAG: alpha/beta fold hydrolase [Coprobacillaceae bacterium]